MANNRSSLQETAYHPAKRIVKATAGPYGSLQLPVTIANEEYKAVIDVGLPTSLVSTGLWQKFNSALYPTTDNDITQRVMRRTNLQLMGYTHFQLQVKDTLLELEEVLVYDFDEPEIFLNISAVAALGLVIDFQEGTFGLRQQEGFKVCWTEDTLLYPDDRLGNSCLQNAVNPGFGPPNAPAFGGGEYMHPPVPVVPFGVPPFGGQDGNAMGQMGMGAMPMGPIPMGPIPMGPPLFHPMGPGMKVTPLGFQTSRNQAYQRKKVGGKMNFFNKRQMTVVNVPINEEQTINAMENNKTVKLVDTKVGLTPKQTHFGPSPTSSKNNFSSVNKPKVTKTNLTNIKNMFNNMKSKPTDKYGFSNNHKEGKNFDADKYNQSNPSKRKSSPSRGGFPNDSEHTGKKSKLQCVNCGANNHFISNCHKPIVLKCQACGRVGHNRNDCPTLVKASALSKSNATTSIADAQKTKTPIENSSIQQSEFNVAPSTPIGENLKPATTSNSPGVPSTVSSTPVTVENTTPGKRTVRKVIVKKVLVKKGTTVEATGISPAGNRIIRRVVKSQPEQQSPTGTARTVVKKIASSPKQEGNKADPIKSETAKPAGPNSVPDLDDVFKKPEADLLVRKPVKRVVTKKAIKLNMLSPVKASDGAASPKPDATTDSSAETC